MDICFNSTYGLYVSIRQQQERAEGLWLLTVESATPDTLLFKLHPDALPVPAFDDCYRLGTILSLTFQTDYTRLPGQSETAEILLRAQFQQILPLYFIVDVMR